MPTPEHTPTHAPDDPAATGPDATRTGTPAPDDTPPLSTGGATAPAGPGFAFDIEEEIGRGGMGVVYRARQRGLNRPVAVKMLLGDTRPGSKELIRFLAEAEAVAAVRHPNVVEVYEYGERDGCPYLVLEFCGAGSLAGFLKTHPALTPRGAAELVAKIARGVAAAHNLGIVHRDLKPGNVLLRSDERGTVNDESKSNHGAGAGNSSFTVPGSSLEPKVSDFGLAKRGFGADLTRTVAVMGTPAYMSPEQAGGKTKFVGPQADVWALGVILFECLTGRRPFRHRDPDVLMAMIRTEEPPSTRSQSKTIPRDLDTICRKCLEKNPADRYPTAAELADDLGRFLRGEPVSVKPVSAATRAWKWAKRNPGYAALWAGLALALVTGTGVSVAYAREADAKRVRAESAEAATSEKARELAVALDATRKAEARAATERDTLKEVNDFFRLKVLRLASAYWQGGATFSPDPELKVRAALDAAARTIDGQFPDRPLVEASVRLTIGETYRDLGLLPKADPHLRLALSLREQHLGPDHPDALSAAAALAWLRATQGRYPEAERLRRRVWDATRARAGDDDPDTLLAADQMVVLYLARDRDVEARELAAKILEPLERRCGPEDERTLSCLGNLGQALYRLGRHAEAEPLFVRCLELRRRVFGDDHPRTLLSVNDLAVLRATQGRHAEAKKLRDEVLETQRRIFGDDHPHTLASLFNLAVDLETRGDYPAAEKAYADACDRHNKVLGENHPSTLTARAYLGKFAFSRGRFDRAEEILGEVFKARKWVLGADHPDTLRTMSDFGAALSHRGKPEAGPLLEDAHRILRELCGDDCSDTLGAALELGAHLRSRAEYGRAEELLRKAADGFRRLRGPGHARTLLAMNNLGYVYFDQGQFDRLEVLLREILEASAVSMGEHHPERLVWMVNLASVYRRQGKFAEAEPLVEQALAAQRKAAGDLDPRTLAMTGILADLRTDAGRHREASDLLAQELAGERKVYPPDDPALAGTLADLGLSLIRQRRYSDAEPLLREAVAIREKKAPDDWRRFSALGLLGESLLNQGKYADAEKPLSDGYAGLRERAAKLPPARRNEILARAARLLARLTESTGDIGAAAKYRAEAARYPETAPPPRAK